MSHAFAFDAARCPDCIVWNSNLWVCSCWTGCFHKNVSGDQSLLLPSWDGCGRSAPDSLQDAALQRSETHHTLWPWVLCMDMDEHVTLEGIPLSSSIYPWCLLLFPTGRRGPGQLTGVWFPISAACSNWPFLEVRLGVINGDTRDNHNHSR